MHFRCAMKVIQKKKVENLDPVFRDMLREELQALEQLDHPHIVRVVDLLEDEENIYIAAELMRHGNLLEVINEMQNKQIKFNEADIANIAFQLTLAVNYIHASDMIHRDLKLENIMVDIEDDEEELTKKIVCKITDFGFATMIEQRKKTLAIGSPIYMAPDVLNSQYDTKADIWSLGVIVYILLTSKKPFDGENDEELYTKIRYHEPDYEGLSHYFEGGEYATDFLRKCLNKNANARYNAHDLLRHKWFEQLVINCEVPEEQLVDTGLNIYSFKQASMFQSSIIAFLVQQKSEKEELRQLGDIFKSLDTSGDGYLQLEEIQKGFETMNNGLKNVFGKEADWEKVAHAIDTNNDGLIDYDEFMTAASNRVKLLNEKNLRDAFTVLDKTGDGYISADEL